MEDLRSNDPLQGRWTEAFARTSSGRTAKFRPSSFPVRGFTYPREDPRMAQLGMIPPELRALKQWVVWRTVTRDGKDTKPPFNPRTGELARTHDQEDKTYKDKPEDTWGTFEEACSKLRNRAWEGIGFVFTENDPYCGIDIDDCFGVSGKPSDEAKRVVACLNSYTERSPSGKGVHIIIRGSLPPDGRKKGHIEMYDQCRYFTMTGDSFPKHSVIEERQDELTMLHDSIFGLVQKPSSLIPTAQLSLGDSEIIEKARSAKNGSMFTALYDYGDTRRFDGDDSRADLSLSGMLAFWTEGDIDRMDRLFRGSALYRPKWDRADYSQRTLQKAVLGKTEFYRPNGHTHSVVRETNLTTKTGRQPADEPEDEHEFLLTERGDAERFVHLHGHDLHYLYETDTWYVWDEQRWNPDLPEQVDQRIKQTIRGLIQEAAESESDSYRKQLWKEVRKADTARHASAMARLARSEPGIPVRGSQLDQNGMLFNCANGTINLKTGCLEPPRREDLITKITPVEYLPGYSSPLWDRFLNRIMPDDEIRTFLQRASGYALSADVSEQCFFFLHGSGANGKSVFLAVLLACMGEYAMQAAPDLLLSKRGEHVPTDLAELKGRRFVATIEVDEGRRFAEGLVKQMTGGDRMKARFMRQDFFEFPPTHKIFMAANHRPIIRGTDLAIWRRVMLVPFTETIPEPERDRNLTQKLLAELPAVLDWCVQGCLDWQKDGLRPPAAVKAEVESYRVEQDVTGQFIEALCTVRSGVSVNAGRLYQAYKAWTEANGYHPVTSTDFGRQLTERGHPSVKKNSQVLRLGIDLTDENLGV